MLLTAKRDRVIATIKISAIESAKNHRDADNNLWKNLVLVPAVKKGRYKTKPAVVASLRYREWLHLHRLGRLICITNNTDAETSPHLHVFMSYKHYETTTVAHMIDWAWKQAGMKSHITTTKVRHTWAGLCQNSAKLTSEQLLEVASAMDHSVRMQRETYALNEHENAAKFRKIIEIVAKENNFAEALLEVEEHIYCQQLEDKGVVVDDLYPEYEDAAEALVEAENIIESRQREKEARQNQPLKRRKGQACDGSTFGKKQAWTDFQEQQMLVRIVLTIDTL